MVKITRRDVALLASRWCYSPTGNERRVKNTRLEQENTDTIKRLAEECRQ